jgi:hypothetical protein
VSAVRTGDTIQAGRVVPEAEVERGDRIIAAPFQVREAVTVRSGLRGRRGKTAGSIEEVEAEVPGQSFYVRQAVTVTLPPPHWATLTQQEETEHVP